MAKSPGKIKEEFRLRGLSISGWAKRNGFSQALVYQVLSGQRTPVRGESHRIAVRLGLIDGSEEGYDGLACALKNHNAMKNKEIAMK